MNNFGACSNQEGLKGAYVEKTLGFTITFKESKGEGPFIGLLGGRWIGTQFDPRGGFRRGT